MQRVGTGHESRAQVDPLRQRLCYCHSSSGYTSTCTGEGERTWDSTLDYVICLVEMNMAELINCHGRIVQGFCMIWSHSLDVTFRQTMNIWLQSFISCMNTFSGLPGSGVLYVGAVRRIRSSSIIVGPYLSRHCGIMVVFLYQLQSARYIPPKGGVCSAFDRSILLAFYNLMVGVHAIIIYPIYFLTIQNTCATFLFYHSCRI